MSTPNPINTLKQAVRVKDAKLAGKAVDLLRAKGFNYRDCYNFAKAGNENLTMGDWEDLMMEADAS